MEIKIIKERRKTASCSFKNGMLVVKIPYWINLSEEKRVLDRFVQWANKKLTQNPDLLNPTSIPSFQSGNWIHVRNQQFVIFIHPNQPDWNLKDQICNSPNTHLLSIKSKDPSPNNINKAVAKAIGTHFLPSVTKRVHQLNELSFRQTISAVRLKYMKTRWGSCSSKGNINLSSRLLLAPSEVMDYVIIHELAHRIEMNHSYKFWRLVSKVDPYYKDKEDWLKRNGRTCEFKPIPKSDQ